MQWVREKGCEWNERTCQLASEEGHLEILQWARDHGCDWDPDKCFDGAQRRGHSHVAEWIEPFTTGYDPGAGYRYMVAGESKTAKDAKDVQELLLSSEPG